MPLDGVATIQLLGSLPGGQQVANTFHIVNLGSGSPPDPADLVTLASDVDTYMGTQWKAILPTTGLYDAVKVAQVPDPRIAKDPYADYILPKNVAGTRALSNETAPNEACCCLSLKTNSGQRSYRGHILLPSCLQSREMQGENFQGAGAYLAACTAFAAKLQDGCLGSHVWTGTKLASYTLAIYSKVLAADGKPYASEVVTVVTNARIHWLRSRARGTT